MLYWKEYKFKNYHWKLKDSASADWGSSFCNHSVTQSLFVSLTSVLVPHDVVRPTAQRYRLSGSGWTSCVCVWSSISKTTRPTSRWDAARHKYLHMSVHEQKFDILNPFFKIIPHVHCPIHVKIMCPDFLFMSFPVYERCTRLWVIPAPAARNHQETIHLWQKQQTEQTRGSAAGLNGICPLSNGFICKLKNICAALLK